MSTLTITYCPWPLPSGWCSTCQRWDRQMVAEFVERSVSEQGLPAKVTDPAVLQQVAVLLGAGHG